MNRKELIKKICNSNDIGISKKAIKLFLDLMEDVISEGISSEGIVRIKGFGTFKKVSRKSRIARLPKGDIIEISDKYAIKFIPHKSLQDKLNISHPQVKSEPKVDTINEKLRKVNIKESIGSSNQGGVIISDNHRPKTGTVNRDLITGERQQVKLRRNISKPEYIGSTIHGEQFHQISEWQYYPNIYIPAKDTKILSAVKSNRQTKGIAENILGGIIEQAVSCVPEIRIQDNMSIPIIGTNQCYYPDFVLAWEEEKIYIDIEIDEKYNIKSGTPIHFIGSRDEERDVYLVEQGWCVLRISEEDVVSYPQELVQTIKYYLYFISYDSRLKPIQQQTLKVKRWTYVEAKEAAEKHFREKLLNIPENSYEGQSDENIQDGGEISSFVPERYKVLEKQIIAAQKAKYVIITVYPNGGQYAFENNSIEIIKDKFWNFSGYDVIEEKEILKPFYSIYKIEGRDDIIADKLDTTSDIIQRCKDVTKKINIARLSCNPIKFSYTNSQGIPSYRVVVYLSYWFSMVDDENLTMEEKIISSSSCLYKNGMRNPVNNGYVDYFSGYCLKRKEYRTFKTTRINDLIVYNIYKPHPEVVYDISDIWDCLEKGKLNVIEYMIETIPPFTFDTYLYKGNKCNYLIMKGELDEAYKEIISISPDFIVHKVSMKWKDIVLSDCEHFIENNNHADNFREIVSRLKSYWNIT